MNAPFRWPGIELEPMPHSHALGAVEVDSPLPRDGWLMDVHVDWEDGPLAAVNLFAVDGGPANIVVNWAKEGTTVVDAPLAVAVGRGYWAALGALAGSDEDPWSYLRWLAAMHGRPAAGRFLRSHGTVPSIGRTKWALA